MRSYALLILSGNFGDLHQYGMVDCGRNGMMQQSHKEASYRLAWDLDIDVWIAWGQAISRREDCKSLFSSTRLETISVA